MPFAATRNDDPALGLVRVIRDDGRTDPVTDPFLPPETLLAIHRELLRARLVDRAMIELQRQGRIGSYNAADGQEAVAVGAAFALEPTDWVFPARRENAVLLVRGFPLDAYLAQLFGNASDSQKGRQAPGHASARSLCVASTSAAIATQLPHAVGMAWAARRDGSRTAVLGFVGDGGTSSGDFHAAMNFAAVYRAPCIIVVQNNQFAISTPSNRQTASVTFAAKARAYGMPALRVDGSDVLAVYRGITDARVRAVAGAGPTLVECVTRCPPHEGARDPLQSLARHLSYLSLMDGAAESALEAEILSEIAAATARAEAVSAPARETLFDDVYASRLSHLDEQAAHLVRR
jgi:pyruvate dehydrogenase E1 component alpha subunit/2-oxoisovalerate dehydrogenase E1 component alpha subunit